MSNYYEKWSQRLTAGFGLFGAILAILVLVQWPASGDAPMETPNQTTRSIELSWFQAPVEPVPAEPQEQPIEDIEEPPEPVEEPIEETPEPVEEVVEEPIEETPEPVEEEVKEPVEEIPEPVEDEVVEEVAPKPIKAPVKEPKIKELPKPPKKPKIEPPKKVVKKSILPKPPKPVKTPKAEPQAPQAAAQARAVQSGLEAAEEARELALKEQIMAKLLALVGQHKYYPRSAKKRRITGVVNVKIFISKDVILADFEVIDAPHELLARCVAKTIERIGEKPLVTGESIQPFSLILPVRFELK